MGVIKMNRENIEEILKKLGSEDVPADVHKIAEETARKFSESLLQTKQPKHYVLWEYIMKSRITRLAAAAAIIVVAIIGVSQFLGGTVTFANVIKPILNAHTVVFDFVMGKDETGMVLHDIVVGSRIRRTFSNMDTVLIIDTDNAKMLTLDPASKGAVYMDIKGPLQEGTKSFIGLVRNIITNLKDMPVKELGQREIDGQKAVGFLINDGPNTELTIWADSKTALPIRIEMVLGQSFYILKNIEFDVPVDESLVSMEPPAGYTLSDKQFDMSQFTEQDFIESLRLWTELLLNGMFPEKMSVEDLMSQTPAIGEKIGQMSISDEQKTQLGMKFGRGAVFFQQLDPHGADWHYAGNGVKLGDAEKAIFWYQPKESKTYRVIYGDLSVKEAAPENLPK
jgi:outer membrane lipoprotein-sorting protein